MTRSELREQIFKLLFRIEFNEAEDMGAQQTLFLADDECKFSQKDATYIADKYEKIYAALDDIDEMIFAKAEGWSKGRMGKVELTILRLAVYEILFDEAVPASVAINEAVELGKTFGSDNSGSFINGVLAKFVK